MAELPDASQQNEDGIRCAPTGPLSGSCLQKPVNCSGRIIDYGDSSRVGSCSYLQVATKPPKPEMPVSSPRMRLMPETTVGTVLLGAMTFLKTPFT